MNDQAQELSNLRAQNRILHEKEKQHNDKIKAEYSQIKENKTALQASLDQIAQDKQRK